MDNVKRRRFTARRSCFASGSFKETDWEYWELTIENLSLGTRMADGQWQMEKAPALRGGGWGA